MNSARRVHPGYEEHRCKSVVTTADGISQGRSGYSMVRQGYVAPTQHENGNALAGAKRPQVSSEGERAYVVHARYITDCCAIRCWGSMAAVSLGSQRAWTLG